MPDICVQLNKQTNKQTKRLKTKEFEEKKNYRSVPSVLSYHKPYFGRFGQKVPKSAKWDNFPKKNFFSSSTKGLKRWKKWLRSQRKGFRRGGIEVKWWKKKNKKFFWDFNGANGHEGAPNLPIRQHFYSSCSKNWYNKSVVGFADFSKKNCLVLEDGFKTRFLATLLPAKKTLLPWNFDLFLILRFFYSEGRRIQRSFLDLGSF